MSDPRFPNSPFEGGSLLDKSTAKCPDNFDMSIFKPKPKPAPEGYTSSDYLQKTKADNPENDDSANKKTTVSLTACKFSTTSDALEIEEEFQAEVKAQWTGSVSPKWLRVMFAVKMTWDNDGAPQEEEGMETLTGFMQGDQSDQVVTVKGELPRPPSFPPAGTKISYKLVASHPEATYTSESDAVDLTLKEKLHYVEVPDLHFALNGHFPCLDENGSLVSVLVKALQWSKENPDEQLVVFGHADTSGDYMVNYDISDRRAQATVALIHCDGAAWESLARKAKVEEIQRYLKALTTKYGWSCDPGEVDDQNGPATESAVKAFQKTCNARYKLGLAEDGFTGPKTWKAMHRVICGLVADALGVVNPGNQAYPEWAVPEIAYPEGNGAYGCGESFPVKDVDVDGLVSEENRRVDFLFCIGWNFLDPVPDRTRALTKDECMPYDLEKVEWLAVEGDELQTDNESGYVDVPVIEKHFDEGHFLPNLANDDFLEVLAGILDFHKSNGTDSIAEHPESESNDKQTIDQRLQVADAIVHGKLDSWSDLLANATIKDVQTFLKFFASKGWPCDPGPIDGLDGHQTWTSVYLFQITCNQSCGTDLATDGVCGPKTWAAMLNALQILIGNSKDEQ